jgi:hypothetical protein
LGRTRCANRSLRLPRHDRRARRPHRLGLGLRDRGCRCRRRTGQDGERSLPGCRRAGRQAHRSAGLAGRRPAVRLRLRGRNARGRQPVRLRPSARLPRPPPRRDGAHRLAGRAAGTGAGGGRDGERSVRADVRRRRPAAGHRRRGAQICPAVCRPGGRARIGGSRRVRAVRREGLQLNRRPGGGTARWPRQCPRLPRIRRVRDRICRRLTRLHAA